MAGLDSVSELIGVNFTTGVRCAFVDKSKVISVVLENGDIYTSCLICKGHGFTMLLTVDDISKKYKCNSCNGKGFIQRSTGVTNVS